MANGVQLSTTTVRDARPPRSASRMARPRESGQGRVFVIPFGCLLVAMLCVAALSRVVPLASSGADGVSIERASTPEPTLPTSDALDGGEAMLRFGPAYSR